MEEKGSDSSTFKATFFLQWGEMYNFAGFSFVSFLHKWWIGGAHPANVDAPDASAKLPAAREESAEDHRPVDRRRSERVWRQIQHDSSTVRAVQFAGDASCK